MNNRSLSALEQKRENINQNNNYYVLQQLNPYIRTQLEKLNEIGAGMSLNPSQLETVHLIFLSEIEKIPFNVDYTQGKFRHRRVESDHVQAELFATYMQEKLPALNNPTAFIKRHVVIKDHSAEIIVKAREISDAINQYLRGNKRSMIDDFNARLKTMLDSFTPQKNNPDAVRALKEQMCSLIENLQDRENTYYRGLTFFAESRKKNSRLQPYLDTAKGYLLGLNEACDKVAPPLREHVSFR